MFYGAFDSFGHLARSYSPGLDKQPPVLTSCALPTEV